MWNATVEHQLTSTMTVEVAYVGNKGTHGFAGNGPAYNLNQRSIVGFGSIAPDQRRRLLADSLIQVTWSRIRTTRASS